MRRILMNAVVGLLVAVMALSGSTFAATQLADEYFGSKDEE